LDNQRILINQGPVFGPAHFKQGKTMNNETQKNQEQEDLQQLLEELFSEIEIPDPVGYGEVEINPEDLQ